MSQAGEHQRLAPAVRRFLEESGHFAIVATINPDGTPHQAVTWYLLDGDAVVLNSKMGRRWPANLLRDARVGVLVADGYRWVSLRGEVVAIHDQRRAHADIAAMARRYHAGDLAAAERQIRRFETEERVSFVVRTERVAADLEE